MGIPTTDSLRSDEIKAVWALVKDQHQELAKKALVHLQAHSPPVADSIEAFFDENPANTSKRVIDLVDEAVVTGQWDEIIQWFRAPIGFHSDTNLTLSTWVMLFASFRAVSLPLLVKAAKGDEDRTVQNVGGFDYVCNHLLDGIGSLLKTEHGAFFLRSVVENIPNMIFVKDAQDLRFVRFNRAGEKLLGYNRKDLLGKNDYDFFPKEEADFFTQKDRDVLKEKIVVDIPEETIQTKYGERILHTKKIPILGPDGQPVYLLGISEDITETIEVRKELQAAKEAAESASLAKGEFLARMSHEIRTPLHTIGSMLEFLGQTDLASAQREYLNMSQDSAEVLSRVIDDILDFSKMESKGLLLESRPFSMEKMVTSTLSPFEMRCSQKGLAFDVHLHPNVPKNVSGDSFRLRQVLFNLLENAVRFTETGGIKVRIETVATQGQIKRVCFSVLDTGIGIPDEKRTSVFHSFAQADSTITRKYGGTGLGLAIVQQIVEAMDGELSMDSIQGKGSSFRVIIPMEIYEGDIETQKSTVFKGQPRQLSILVAEDNIINQRVTAQMLKSMGHLVDVAGTGEEAVDRVGNKNYDAVLMDLQMPKMDGLEATRQIRAREKQVGVTQPLPILALTAHALPEFKALAKGAGLNGFLIKPFLFDNLREKVLEISAEIPPH